MSASEGPIRSALYRFYYRAETLIARGLRSSQYAYYEKLRSALSKTSRWLDLGCGHQVFADWMTGEQQQVIENSGTVVGIDLDWPGLRQHAGIQKKIFGDLTHLPFRSSSFDVVSANMVMEHLPQPSGVLTEVRRILSPRGLFVFHTPNYYHWGTLIAVHLPERLKKLLIRFFEQRREEDVFPTYYRINTAAAVRRLAEQCGFHVVELTLVSSSATLVMFGPVVLLELLFIRLIQHSTFANLRSNLVVVLRKDGPDTRSAPTSSGAGAVASSG